MNQKDKYFIEGCTLEIMGSIYLAGGYNLLALTAFFIGFYFFTKSN